MPSCVTARWVRRGTTRGRSVRQSGECWVWGIREADSRSAGGGFESRTCTREIWADEMKGNALDFSFSGLKRQCCITCVNTANTPKRSQTRRGAYTRRAKIRTITAAVQCENAGAGAGVFRMQWCAIWLKRTMSAAEGLGVESVLVSGGVAANSQLRATFEERTKSAGVEVFFPSRALSTIMPR